MSALGSTNEHWTNSAALETESMCTNETRKQILALAALALLTVPPAKLAGAEGDSGPLLVQLTRAYRLASPAIETDGSSAFVGGTVLLVQRPGVVGYDHANIALEEICPARLEEGQLNPPRSVVCNVPTRQSRKAFPVADPVCITAFRLSEAIDQLSIYLIECGAGVRIRTDRAFYALVEIQLPKGTLRTGSLHSVQSEIATVLAPESAVTVPKPAYAVGPNPATAIESKPEQEAPPLAPLPVAAPASQSAPGPATPAEPERLPPPLPPLPESGAEEAQSPPASASVPAPGSTANPTADSTGPAATSTVAVGQTVDQVEAILGAPSTVGNADGKLIYIYSQRFKIVFLKGKVTEINPLDNSQ
jgi:hypothetical protein